MRNTKQPLTLSLHPHHSLSQARHTEFLWPYQPKVITAGTRPCCYIVVHLPVLLIHLLRALPGRFVEPWRETFISPASPDSSSAWSLPFHSHCRETFVQEREFRVLIQSTQLHTGNICLFGPALGAACSAAWSCAGDGPWQDPCRLFRTSTQKIVLLLCGETLSTSYSDSDFH